MSAGSIGDSSRGAGKRTRGSRIAFWFASLGGAVAVVLVLVLFVFVFGRVQGVEICADTLERRSFGFWELPVIGYQIRGTEYVDVSGDLEKHLGTASLVPAPPAKKKTWHVIYVSRGLQGMRRGDPEILVRYLEARNSSHDLAWLEWTKANPQLAPAVWQSVCKLAKAGKYTTIPDVLELAISASDPVKTGLEISRIVKESVEPSSP
jgi:hypothetical protein